MYVKVGKCMKCIKVIFFLVQFTFYDTIWLEDTLAGAEGANIQSE